MLFRSIFHLLNHFQELPDFNSWLLGAFFFQKIEEGGEHLHQPNFFDFLKEESAKQPRIKIRQFLEMIEQMENHELGLPVNKTVFREEGVNFITAHSAKGLEFQHVFMLGCTADKWESTGGGGSNFSLPDTLTFTKDENKIESLRRLFYVAMTRAKEHLHISFSEARNEGKKLEQSSFVAEVVAGTGNKIIAKKIEAEDLFELGVQLLSKTEKPHIELFNQLVLFFSKRANDSGSFNLICESELLSAKISRHLLLILFPPAKAAIADMSCG